MNCVVFGINTICLTLNITYSNNIRHNRQMQEFITIIMIMSSFIFFSFLVSLKNPSRLECLCSYIS